MQGHICKHGMLRKCSSMRCGYCRKMKKKPDNVEMPAKEIDRFNEHISMLHVETLKDCQSLIKRQSKLIDELFSKISNLNYQQHVLLEVTKRSAMAIVAQKDGDCEKAEKLISSVKPMMEEAFVMESEGKNDKKEQAEEDPEEDPQEDNEGYGEN